MFDYEKRIIKNFDEDGSEEAMKDKKDFLLFTFMETKKELSSELNSKVLVFNKEQRDRMKTLLEKLEFLAREL